MNFEKGDKVELTEAHGMAPKGERGIVTAPFMGATVQGICVNMPKQRDDFGADFFIPASKLKKVES